MFLSKVTVYSAAVCKLPHQMWGENSDRTVSLQYSAGCRDGETKASVQLRVTFTVSFQKYADFTNCEQSTETSSIISYFGEGEKMGGNSPLKTAKKQ